MAKAPSDKLREARLERGFATSADAARHFGWNIATYTSHENGTRGIRKDAATRYASAYGISASQLLGLSIGKVAAHTVSNTPIVGEAAWGVWREARMLGQGVGALPIPNIDDSDIVTKALLISDDSLDRVLKKGDYVIYRDVELSQLPVLNVGQLVVVHHTRDALIEVTVRRVASVEEDEVRLTTHATKGSDYDAIAVPFIKRNDVKIVGLVTGSYRSHE